MTWGLTEEAPSLRTLDGTLFQSPSRVGKFLTKEGICKRVVKEWSQSEPRAVTLFKTCLIRVPHCPHYPLAGAFEPVGARRTHMHVHVMITDGADDHVGCICD